MDREKNATGRWNSVRVFRVAGSATFEGLCFTSRTRILPSELGAARAGAG